MHPWIWLNEPQHGSAIQAVAGIVYTVASIVVGGFAVGTYKSTKEQTRIARGQVEATERHYAEQRDELKRERALREAQAMGNFQKQAYQEESDKPRWVVAHTNTNPAHIVLENTGGTPALQLMCRDDCTNKMQGTEILKPGQSHWLAMPMGAVIPTEVVVMYRSVYGTKWTLRFRNTNPNKPWHEEVLGVDRPYAIPNMEA